MRPTRMRAHEHFSSLRWVVPRGCIAHALGASMDYATDLLLLRAAAASAPRRVWRRWPRPIVRKSRNSQRGCPSGGGAC
jgi:hypothetical protein